MTLDETDRPLEAKLRSLKLGTMAAQYRDLARQAEREHLSHEAYLQALVDQELTAQRNRRVERLLKESKLPREKTFDTFDLGRIPCVPRSLVKALSEGEFLDRAENVLAFGNPGTGKTHLLCAIAHELVKRGRAVLFTPTFLLVQLLLRAKKDLRLAAEIKRLDRFEAVLLDDIGYVQQERAEMEVLFTFLSERYERRSVLITSNLVFSKWEQIFKDSMVTAAAIDRIVHHARIIELDVESYRAEEAHARRKQREGRKTEPPQGTAPALSNT